MNNLNKMKNIVFYLFIVIYIFLLSLNPIIAQPDRTFANPILAGFYPDPSICKVDDNYYLVTSTFSYFPGIPVFQSKDLVNWKLIGHVLDKPKQLNLEGQGVSRGLFAPTIRYDNGLYYVTCTLVDQGGNFIVTAKSPEGPWSNPVFLLEAEGIDPSMFFDDNGKAYIIYNSIAPDNKPLYDGHRTIRMSEVDKNKLKIIGKEVILINGGDDLSKKPVWIEAPHIFKVNGIYYLIAAEGGTADQHSEVVFKSDKVDGPYIPYEKNPILTQRDLDPNREYPITSTGHADFVQTNNGDWWAVFLGIRPYIPDEGGYDNTGRETFLAPIKWIDGWPVINPDYKEVQYFYPYPLSARKDFAIRPYGGNFTLRDDFNNKEISKDFIFLRTPHHKWFNLDDKQGFLSLDLRKETCSGKSNPSFLGLRQQHINCSVSTSLIFDPSTNNEKSGLLVFLNENRFYFLCKSLENNGLVIQLYKSVENENTKSTMELVTSAKISDENAKEKINFKIKAAGKYYSFFYSFNNERWKLLKENLDATYLRVVIPQDFTGCIFALYATSLGKESNNKGYYDYFEYIGDDDVYKPK
jgi:xylan 1,4-beta-xylosidase